ncbi:MAG: hypothetical protein HGA85_06730 [Nanoarchaeota archaeon]|nr:hypothetical protein [Nanoarchaeota archaeon]
MKQTARNMKRFFVLAVILSSLFFFVRLASSEPEGATVAYVSNTTKNASTPDSRTDAKGTITTINLNTLQQDIKWKAYVGNVSGTLVLRDSEDYSIYEWAAGGSPSGEVYLARNSSIDWTNIRCANQSVISIEETTLGFVSTAQDNINNTFAYNNHTSFDVGTVTIAESSCKNTATWMNDTAQTVNLNALFQEVLLMDTSDHVVYASIINQDTASYKNDSLTKYDFQAIVPDFVSATIATYYFYVEITG